MYVSFNILKMDRWEINFLKFYINWVILDSDWEVEFCRVVEFYEKVIVYVKNYSLGLEVFYCYGFEIKKYRFDFIVLIDDGCEELLNFIVEIKGFCREDVKEKKLIMDIYWIFGVNNLKSCGRWVFVEFRDVFEMEYDFK